MCCLFLPSYRICSIDYNLLSHKLKKKTREKQPLVFTFKKYQFVKSTTEYENNKNLKKIFYKQKSVFNFKTFIL